MTEQYYTQDPSCLSKPVPCSFPFRGVNLRMQTDSGVFSKGVLDEGTRLLLDTLPDLTGQQLDIADMGCGWGAIGTAVAKRYPGCRVVMADVNRRALGLAEENLTANRTSAECIESDGFSALMDRTFDLVITNPPIRAGKKVIYGMFADAEKTLRPGGSLYLVIRKQQGAESAMKYLSTLFAGVERLARENGYWILAARKAEEVAISDKIG